MGNADFVTNALVCVAILYFKPMAGFYLGAFSTATDGDINTP
jgi:hypothetical protein